MAVSTFYLTTTAADYTPPTLQGAWDDTAGAVTRALSAAKAYGGAITTVSRAEINASPTWDVLLYRGVSGPLAAQTISGTLDVVLGILEANADADFYWHLHVYVTQGDSDTPRGTLLADYVENTTNEWPTAATGKGLQSAQTLAAIGAITAGDRLVIEIGYIARNSHTTSRAGTLSYGTLLPTDFSEAADLTVGSTSPTTLAGSLRFSVALVEQVVDVRGSQLLADLMDGGDATIRGSQLFADLLDRGDSTIRGSQLYLDLLTRDLFLPTYEDPCAIKTPLFIRVIQTLADPNVPGVYDTLAVANAPLRDHTYVGSGYKSPRILEWGPCVKAASDWLTGSFEAQTSPATLADPDEAVRTFIAAHGGSLLASEVSDYLVSPTHRATGGDPRLIAQGRVS